MSGQNKVKEIADILKNQTLEPARKEASEIIAKARRQAEEIVQDGKKRAETLIATAKKEIDREQGVFQSSLKHAYHQTLEKLRQAILDKFFSKYLKELMGKNVQDPKALAQLITALVKAIEKEGTDADISAYISSAIPVKTVNEHLAKEIIDALREKSVLLTGISGGVQVKIHENNVVLDISDKVLEEMLAERIREDFRELIFAKPS